MPLLIGLNGRAGAGKSTVAALLAERHGFARVRFADPLKGMLRAFLAATGVSAADIERTIEGDLKEVACPQFAGRTPRHAMQTLGTEWGRDLLGPDFWRDAWIAGARRHLAAGVSVVAEDCRFVNEAGAVRALGGVVLRIEGRAASIPDAAHASELQPVIADLTIWNDGSVEALGRRVYGMVERLKGFADQVWNEPALG